MEIVVRKCPSHGDVEVKVLRPDLPAVLWPGGHWGKGVCPQCDRYLCWVPKPNDDATKYRRPASHKELADKYSQGFCELCMRDEKDLPAPQVLEGHHVVEFDDGGSNERSNVWVVCTACHRLIHHQRTYLGHIKNMLKRP